MSSPTSFRLEGHARAHEVMTLHRQLTEALNRGADTMSLELAGLTVMSTSTMGLLCGALRGLRLPARHARLQITGAPRLIRRVLSVCAIDGLELAAHVPAARRLGDPAISMQRSGV